MGRFIIVGLKTSVPGVKPRFRTTDSPNTATKVQLLNIMCTVVILVH